MVVERAAHVIRMHTNTIPLDKRLNKPRPLQAWLSQWIASQSVLGSRKSLLYAIQRNMHKESRTCCRTVPISNGIIRISDWLPIRNILLSLQYWKSYMCTIISRSSGNETRLLSRWSSTRRWWMPTAIKQRAKLSNWHGLCRKFEML